jgi:DNA polymerase eta
LESYFCKACRRVIPQAEEDEHRDWHFAKDLQDENVERPNGAIASRLNTSGAIKPTRGSRGTARARGGKPQKGQKRLAFG